MGIGAAAGITDSRPAGGAAAVSRDVWPAGGAAAGTADSWPAGGIAVVAGGSSGTLLPGSVLSL